MTTRKWVIGEINSRTNNPLLLNGAVSNLDRNVPLANLSALTTQVMLSTALPLAKGFTVTNLTFVSATTGAGTPTNWWFALYDTSGNKVAQTADQLTAAWAGSTAKTVALSTPYSVPATGVFYAAIMVKATTVPTLAGVSLLNTAVAGAVAGAKVAAQTSGSALTGTAPATIATPATVVNVPLVIAS